MKIIYGFIFYVVSVMTHVVYSSQLNFGLGAESQATGVYSSYMRIASDEGNNAQNSTAKSMVADQLTVSQAYVRAIPPISKVTAAFMELYNPTIHPITVVAARAEIAARVELHAHSMQDGMMQMRAVSEIVVPAGGKVKLEPGGLHLMLFDLKQSLQIGQIIPITLQSKDGQLINVGATVHELH